MTNNELKEFMKIHQELDKKVEKIIKNDDVDHIELDGWYFENDYLIANVSGIHKKEPFSEIVSVPAEFLLLDDDKLESALYKYKSECKR